MNKVNDMDEAIEEAKSIYNNFYEYEVHPNSVQSREFVAKKHSLIHINGRIKDKKELLDHLVDKNLDKHTQKRTKYDLLYLDEVRQELEKL